MDKQFAIFDMDGTLVDSMPFWKSLGREYLAKKGVTEQVDGVLSRIGKMTMSESAALFIESFGFEGTPRQIADEMNAMMDAHYCCDVPACPGVEDYLEALRRKGAVLCVASATAYELMEACLERLGLLRYFSFLLSCEEIGVGKGRPDVYLESARRLGAAPGEIAVYEDALYAARTAKNAGFYTVGIYDESGASVWEELTALADEVITDWAEAAQSL